LINTIKSYKEIIMFTFLVILAFVFVAVDLLVRFVIDPLLASSNKKKKVARSFAPGLNQTIKLAGETMYDGGKLHKEEESNSAIKPEGVSKDSSENIKQ
jgi:hypothetical protein